MNNYTCQSCCEVKDPDDLYPVKVDTMIAGNQYFLLCEECRLSVKESITVELADTLELEIERLR